MRVLLDACLPRRLRNEVPDHDVRTVQFMGWAGLDNGELLRHMVEAGIDVFITVDRNLPPQQNVRAMDIGVIVLTAISNRTPDLLPLVPQIQSALNRIKPGEVIVVGPP